MKLNFLSYFIAFHVFSNVINKISNSSNSSNSLEKRDTNINKYTFDKPCISITKNSLCQIKQNSESTKTESTENYTEMFPVTPRTKSKYTEMTVSQLRKLASIYCIKKYTKMSKDELIYEIHLRKNIL